MYERFVDEVFDELAHAAAYDAELFADRGFEKDGFEGNPFEGYSDLEFEDWDAVEEETCRGFEIDSKNYIPWVQRSLNRNVGSLLPATGEISPEYRQAVKQFQIERGIALTGDVDERTQNNLIKANESDPTYVKWVQRALNTHGYGLVLDGVMGSNHSSTKKAIRDFQQKWVPDLCIDGFIGAKTELRLIQAGGGWPPGDVPANPPNYRPHLSQGVSVPTRFLGQLKRDIESGELSPETEKVLEELGLFETGIIGPKDDRRRIGDTIKAPYRWICLLVLVFPDPDRSERSILFGKLGFGSGLLIGARHILTAAHNLYGSFTRSDGVQLKLPTSAVIVIPGHNSLLAGSPFPFGIYFSSQRDTRPFFRIPDKWRETFLPRYDFGLIRLDESIGRRRFPSLNGKPLGWWGNRDFGHGTYLAPHTPETRKRFENLAITACGYPGDKLSIFGASQWLANGKVRNDLLDNTIGNYSGEIKDCEEIRGTEACNDERYINRMRTYLRLYEGSMGLLAHTADTVAGNSGGPIWMKRADPDGSVRRRLVAIVNLADVFNPFNIGTLLTPGIFEQIRKWMLTR